MSMDYDFCGYATKNDLLCADGRTIRRDAFKDNDGQTVPLVWQHIHDEPLNVLGHALLENRDDGVYAYCNFNDTESGKNAKLLVRHGDVKSLSIYANQLRQKGNDVLHGLIREVSLVLAGANPGAVIEEVSLEHSYLGGDDDEVEYDAIIRFGQDLEMKHEEEPEEEKKEDTGMAEKTVKDVYDTFNEEQKNVVEFLIAAAVEEAAKADDEDEEDEEDGADMKHNVFDKDTPKNTLSHDDMNKIFADAKRLGSLRAAVEEHKESGVLAHSDDYTPGTQGVTYGIQDIDYLFPDDRSLDRMPRFIQDDTGWVSKVMNGVHHSPFSRVKSVFANITADEARAKGFVKGQRKAEEVFTLLRRRTDPQTVYKKQKIDRDDMIDITDFDVVAWQKGEMRMKLNEELARAFLVGDGRSNADEDKIHEDHVRPIWTEDDLFAVKITVDPDDQGIGGKAKNFIRSAIKGRKFYKGSGNPTLYTTEDLLADMLLIEDGQGHFMYDSEDKLAKVLRVKEIVTVPCMEDLSRTIGSDTRELAGIIVNLQDYNVGADKGGEVNMFDDFDIDYNQMKYLIETRCSGALTVPFSALVLEFSENTYAYVDVTSTLQDGDNPKQLGLYEKQGKVYVKTKDTTVVDNKVYYSNTDYVE